MSGAYEPRTYWESTLGDSLSLRGAAHPNLAESFNRALYGSLRHSVTRSLRNHRQLDRLAELDVLDVGFGTGVWLDFWLAAGARSVVGVDLTDVAVEHARRRFPGVEIVRADVADALPFAACLLYTSDAADE